MQKPDAILLDPDAKLAEMIIYIAEKMDGEPTFGATMLNKVLFFADNLFYLETGGSISGADYQKLDHGPAPRRLLPTRKRLVDSGALKIVERVYLGRTQKRPTALRDADRNVFTGKELKVIDQVIDALGGHTATAVSDLSHRLSHGWRLAHPNETIPYNVVYADDTTASDIARATDLINEHNWSG